MIPSFPEPEKESVLQALAAYHRAMVDADTDALNALLTPDFSLTHITGYEQPKDEWFGVIRSAEFDYHRITLDDTLTDVRVDGEQVIVTGRGHFEATINGMRRPWPLAFTMQWTRHDGAWRVQHATYTTF